MNIISGRTGSTKEEKGIEKVIIIGKGVGWNLAPSDDEIDEFTETWGVNDLVTQRNVKRGFEIHKQIWMEDEPTRLTFEKINELKIPVMMVNHYPIFPTSVKYPLDEIIKEFGTDFFTNSIDYMIAYAIYLGVKEIDLYGVNMVLGTEYMFERPGVNFWCAMAMGRGIKVNIYGKDSTIMRCQSGQLYGYLIPQKIDPKFLK